MSNLFRQLILATYQMGYRLARPLIFRSTPQEAHEHALHLLARLDQSDLAQAGLRGVHQVAFPQQEICVGGVTLPAPVILAAGFVKGQGFADEASALAAVERGENIIPGWRSMPALVGAVELGSITRYPRLGNPGTVIWRDAATQSTQNRVGLRNPGAKAAAAFLTKQPLPAHMGINIAVSPGVTDPDQEQQEVLEALAAFQNIQPAWFTLNLSCPNTEDDPTGNQTEDKARHLCGAVVAALGDQVPLWVKISPNLAEAQYRKLIHAFAEVGVQAVIATNTIGQPAPSDPILTAGVGGGKLHRYALDAARILSAEKQQRGYMMDVIGCGGVLDRASYQDFVKIGVPVVQYWSALIYQGPLAGALLASNI